MCIRDSSPICAEIFKDIDKDPVDFVDSYDGAMKAVSYTHLDVYKRQDKTIAKYEEAYQLLTGKTL